MTERTAKRFAAALLNFKDAFLTLADASKAAENYDISDHYPFYLLDYEVIAPAVAQWCTVHANRLISQISYTDDDAPATPQPTEEPEPEKPKEPPTAKSDDELMTEELLLIAKIVDGRVYETLEEYDAAVDELLQKIGPTCSRVLASATKGVKALTNEMYNFIQLNSIVAILEEEDS